MTKFWPIITVWNLGWVWVESCSSTSIWFLLSRLMVNLDSNLNQSRHSSIHLSFVFVAISFTYNISPYNWENSSVAWKRNPSLKISLLPFVSFLFIHSKIIFHWYLITPGLYHLLLVLDSRLFWRFAFSKQSFRCLWWNSVFLNEPVIHSFLVCQSYNGLGFLWGYKYSFGAKKRCVQEGLVIRFWFLFWEIEILWAFLSWSSKSIDVTFHPLMLPNWIGMPLGRIDKEGAQIHHGLSALYK